MTCPPLSSTALRSSGRSGLWSSETRKYLYGYMKRKPGHLESATFLAWKEFHENHRPIPYEESCSSAEPRAQWSHLSTALLVRLREIFHAGILQLQVVNQHSTSLPSIDLSKWSRHCPRNLNFVGHYFRLQWFLQNMRKIVSCIFRCSWTTVAIKNPKKMPASMNEIAHYLKFMGYNHITYSTS